MGQCQYCCPWNEPLALAPLRLATGDAVPLSYDMWIWYRFHVQMHQTPANWGGEIEAYSAELRRLDNIPIGEVQ